MKPIAKRKKEESVSPQALKEMWESIDMPRVSIEVVQGISKDVDAYERARAKSREGAAHQVLL